ncbi:hypothetical protein HKD37_09G024693 [Glycine soja]
MGNLKEEWRKEVEEEKKNLQGAWRRKVEDENKCSKELSNVHVDTMGLYVVGDQCTRLVELGKVYDSLSTIHNVPYADDVVKDSQKRALKSVGHAKMANAVAGIDPLGELVKNLFDAYQKPIELPWDGTKFGIPKDNIVVWFCSLLKKPNVNIKVAVNSAMKTLTTSLEGKLDQLHLGGLNQRYASHVQTGGYEYGYYVMHWMWCIVHGDLKNEWNMWFFDGTALYGEAMTTLCKKWAAYFLQVKNMEFRQI